MKDIYELFESKIEEELDEEYFRIQESLDEFLLIDKPIYTNALIEEVIYNNPEKKRLDVLIEEAEVQKKNNIIDKLIEQMKRVLNWITDIITKHTDMFDAGAEFVKNNDLNKAMLKIKSIGKVPTIEFHPNKTAFPAIRSNRISLIKMTIQQAKNHRGAFKDSANEKYNSKDDTEGSDYQQALTRFKLHDENRKDIPLTNINVVSLMTNLNALPGANKELNSIKNQVKDVYNRAIANIRNTATTDKKTGKADNELSWLNARIREVNETIRSYAKIMRMVYTEDFKAAKSIVNVANGRNVLADDGQQPVKKENVVRKKLNSSTRSLKVDSGNFSTRR